MTTFLLHRLACCDPSFIQARSCNIIQEAQPSALPGLGTLQILLGFEPQGEHMLGVHTAKGWRQGQRQDVASKLLLVDGEPPHV
jgi:hypothetical protein